MLEGSSPIAYDRLKCFMLVKACRTARILIGLCRMKSLTSVFLLLAGLLFASCAPTPEKTYKEFYASQAHRKVGMATDVSVLQDGPGSTDILLSNTSEKYAEILNSHAAAEMKAKGYHVSGEYLSTGLNIPSGHQVFVSNVPDAKTGETITGANTIKRKGSTPTKLQRYSAEHLFERLIALNVVSKAAHDAQFSEVRDLDVPRDSYVLAVSGFTRNVNMSKQIGQGVLVAAVSLGTITMWEPDTAAIQAALIDVRTGKIVWANQVVAQKGSPDFIRNEVSKLFAKMPAYGSTGNTSG